ncbi:MAG: DNA polymerase I [Parachlamydiales bacterium]|nr:DNA polymerase I [Parachlamydiales bacterium]
MERIYILDAVNYLFRSYYAIGPMLNDKGQSTSALFGFIRSVQKLIRDFSPTHFICVFDGPDNKKSRQSVYAEYKMHRKGAPEDLFPQFELAYEYCALAGIPHISVEGVEADDTMATIALWAEKKGAQVFICSSDKDLMQLVNDHIFLLHLHKDNLLIDAAKVQELYGVRPDQMLDLLSIMGDASDNIPGLEGFGPKTAASLLQQFGTLDYILAHPEEVKGEKKQEILRTQQKEALMSRELATLHTKVDVPADEDFYRLKEMDKPRLTDFFQEMKFNTLIRDLGAPPKPAAAPIVPSPAPIQTQNGFQKPHEKCKAALHLEKHDYHLVDTEKDLIALLEKLSKVKEVGIDTETTDLEPLLAHLVGIGFSIEPGEAWYVPLNGQIGKKRVVELLKEFFSTTSAAFFGHNLKYDYHILENLGIHIKHIAFDTLLASYLIDPQKRRHNLDDLTLEKFTRVKIALESLIGKGKKQISMRDVPIEKVKEYCCEDIDYTTRLKELFQVELKERKLDRILHDIELPLLPILAQMERIGIYVDVRQLRVVGEGLVKELHQIKARIFANAGEEFNLNSPKQLSTVLYEKMGLKAGTTSTSADVLEVLAEEHAIAKDILEYRTLEKLRSTYVEALPASVNPITGRIHCTFNQSVTATGRLSSQDPNLQNIPVNSDIRSCFKAKEGCSFLGADYSQIELRLLAHFSDDQELVRAFRSGRDIHVHTASLIYGVPENQVTSDMRKAAKTVNFGIVYGQGPFGLSKQLGISHKDAADFIQTYFARYPGVQRYLEECKAIVRKTGYSTTLTGRQRPIPEINNKNPTIRAAAERLAVNTPLQGTAADLIKLAMIEIDRVIQERKLEGKMLLQIHDELIFEIPDREISIFEKLVKEKMENVLKLNVPIEVHMAVGKTWAEC